MNRYYPQAARRAGHRCEYCRAPEVVFNFTFEIEHVIPTSRGGPDEAGNLALACRACNARKGDAVTGNEGETGEEVPLFDPRADRWAEHFQYDPDSGSLIGLTAVARATIMRLDMNHRCNRPRGCYGFGSTFTPDRLCGSCGFSSGMHPPARLDSPEQLPSRAGRDDTLAIPGPVAGRRARAAPMTPPSVLVLYNEPVLPVDHPDAGSEHDILDTVNDTFKVLKAAGFETTRLGINYDPQPLLDRLKNNRPDAVFNLFEGIATQTGTEVSAAALLEWLNVPFTGCPSPALALGRDKVRTKHLLAAVGLPTPDYAVIDALPVPRWRRPWPAIVKPACQDASIGIDQSSVVTSQKQLEERVAHVLATYGAPVLVERFVQGREFHVNMVEDAGAGPNAPPLVLPLAEIAFKNDRPGKWAVYTFTAKWNETSDEYRSAPLRAPVEIPADDFARLEVIAQRAFRALDCRDYARIDVRMDADGKFYVLEVNPNPYLNSLALVNGLLAIGRTQEQLLVNLTLAAIARGGKHVPRNAVTVPVGVITV